MSHYLYNKGETLKYERGFSLSNFLGELMTDIVKYGFYTVDPDYLEYLNGIDSEVYYTSSYRNTIKPFVGIVVGIGSYNYFIPVSSAKEKHKKWKNVSEAYPYSIMYFKTKTTDNTYISGVSSLDFPVERCNTV